MLLTVAFPLSLVTLGIHLAWIDAACLNYISCYNDLYLNQENFVTLHSSLEERSAVSCATLCLQRWPETQLVMAKLVDVNERLSCGCGDKQAVSDPSGTVNDFYDCYVCPDGDNQKCGSEKTTSVYEVENTNHSCPRVHLTIPEKLNLTSTSTIIPTTASPGQKSWFTTPSIGPWQSSSIVANKTATNVNTTAQQAASALPGSPPLVFLGCYEEERINESLVVTMMLNQRDVNITHCATSCLFAHPATDVFLVKLLNVDRLYCGCGMGVAVDPKAGVGYCDLYCQDDPHQSCGGWVSVSAYIRGAGGAECTLLSSHSLLVALIFLMMMSA
ncbi:uncharacterized protein [Procambarus clarkii]|uniref:uncharacterized protein n=1 Tax=Procambarus clarkii TaxID=6728 RepID=UPI0037432C52